MNRQEFAGLVPLVQIWRQFCKDSLMAHKLRTAHKFS